MPAIVLSHVTKKFKEGAAPALSNINAEIPLGKIIGLAGPDGAGKTTLLRLVAGLLTPSTGTVAREATATLGYMPQRFGLYEDLTVMQNLSLYADLQGIEGRERTDRMKTLLSFTGLEPFTERLTRALSGGMKQKLGLACTLMQKPDLLLLDEPTVGVDPLSRRELWKMVQELLKENITVLWSTAYLDEAARCDEVLLLHEGQLLYQGHPQTLTKRVEGRTFLLRGAPEARRRLMSELLGDADVLDGVIEGDAIRLLLSHKDSPLKSRLTLEEAAPRFEDAYIDILEGGPQSFSPLAHLHSSFPTKSDIAIDVLRLTKRFGDFVAVDTVSFQVRRGEIFGLLGPNGAGKSTTFKMMCGLLTPSEGSVKLYGGELDRAHIGYMAQKFSLYGNLSVRQNLDFFAGIYNLGYKKKKIRCSEMIEVFHLQEYLSDNAEELPLGYKQRLALACAIMHMPPLLFLDEPTSGIDPISRREFWNHIHALVDSGVAVTVTTHFMDEAEYCDRIGLIYRGKLIEVGSPSELKERAKSPSLPEPTLEEAFISLITGTPTARE